MSILDELNAEYGIDEESPAIGSPEERELALEAADLPSLVPTEISDLNAFAPPTESPASVSPGIINTPSIPKLTSTSAIAGSVPETWKIYRTAMQTLGQYPGTIESANAELGSVALEPKKPYATPIPETIQENSIDRANRELQYGSPLKIGDTRDTQSPGLLMPSFYDTEIQPEPEKPRKGIITEALHAPIYGVAQLGQIAAGLTAIAGEAFNSDAITELAKNMYNRSTEFMEPFKPTVQDIRDIGGVGDATRWAVSSIGQMLPFMIGTMGAGAAIKTLITHTLGRSIARKAATTAISRGLADISVKESIGKAMTDLGIKAGMGGMAAATIGAEAGIISSDRLTNGLKVLSSDLLWAIPAGMLDVIPEWRLASKLNLFGKRISNVAMREGIDVARNTFIKDFGKQALLEGITEGWQEILEEAGAGRKPFTYDTMWQAINAFMAAGLAGGVMGAGVNLLTRTPSTPTAETVTPKLGEPGFIGPMVPGIETYAPTTLALPPGQGFTLVNKPESVLHKAWNVPPEAPAPEIFTLQEGRYRPPGKERPTERPGWMGPMEEYYDMLRPTKGEGFVTIPTRKTPPAPTEVISRGAQDLINSQEWAPLQDMWNKLVMGKRETPQLIWGGQYPQHLLYNEREGARGFQSPWVDTEITESGHIVHTDFDGGKLESLFDKDMTTGTEFVPVKYTAPNGDSTILRKGQFLPQSLVDTIQTYLSARQRVLGESSNVAETPTKLGLPASVAITPPVIDGLIYNGIQKVPGEPDFYTFTEKSSGGTFITRDVTTENLTKERNRVRGAFEEPDVKDAIDNDLMFDILKGTREKAQPSYAKYSTGKEVTFRRGGRTITGTFNEMNLDGTMSIGNLPGQPTNMWVVKPREIVQDITRSGKIAPADTELTGGKTKAGTEVPEPENWVPTQRDVEASAPSGSNVTKPTDIYAHARSTGNVWIRQTVEPQNSDRTLLVQFSTNLINPIPTSPGLDRIYYNKLYSGVRNGYTHPTDFWEIPEWIAVASNSLPNSDVYVIRSIDEAVKFFNEARYGNIAFSALEVNSPMIAEIADKYKGRIVVGGYVDLKKQFGKFENVKSYDKIDQFVRDQGFKFFPGTNYRHFQESEVIPRLCLSTGCLHKCSFCDVRPHGKVTEATPENVRRQVESIKKLKPKLVYLNDKTFGQGKNFDVLREVHDELLQGDPSFEGFVIQTTATQFNKLTKDFIDKSGIKYVELGVETFNDDLLSQYHKPIRTNDILKAFQKARDLNILVVPNVIIGLQGETTASYNNTLNFLEANKNIISHVNAYNLAVYAGTDLAETIGPLKPGDMDENVTRKSWIKDLAANQEFSDKLFNFGISQLDKSPEQLYQERTLSPRALSPIVDRIPGFTRFMVFSEDGRLSLRAGSVEEQVTHRVVGGRMELGAISGLVGEVWVDAHTNEVYSLSMYDRKLRGEDVRGIPMDKLDGIQVEGWKNEIAKIDPKFDISERLETGQIQPIVGGLTKEQAWQVVNDLQLKIPQGALRFEVLNSKDEIPQEVMQKLVRTPSPRSRGMYVRSDPIPMVYIFANNNANAAELEKTIFHETLGHFGFEKLVGPERIKAVTKMVMDTYGHEELGYLYRRYGVTPGTKDGDYVVSLEKIAEIAETGSNPTLWQRIVVWFKEIMADIFGNEAVGKLTEDEIRVYLWRSRELIQQQNVPSMGQVYNSMTKLISMRMWNMQLPDGPAGVGSFMREDSSPSDENTARNLGGFMSWFHAHKERNKNFGSGVLKDLGIVEAIGSIPHWISMKFPSFKSVVSVQWDREDKRNRDRLHLLQYPGTNAGDNPYIVQKNTEAIDKIVVWSDQNDTYLQDDQLQSKSRELNGRNLTTEEVSAYHGWKAGFDRAVSYAIDKLRQSAMKLYSDQPWFEQFKGVIDNTIDQSIVVLDPDQLKDFQKAITKTAERMGRIAEREKQLKSMNFYVPHIRGKGEYVVRVFDTDENGKPVRVWVERFENSTKAEAGRIRLKTDYAGLAVEKTYEPRTSEFVYGGLDVPAMEAFLEKATEKAKDKFGVDETAVDKLMDAVYKAIDEEIMARGFRQHYIHRHQGRIIGGYRTEGLHQVFFDYMSGLAGSMTKLDATYDFHKALQSIDKVNERGVYEYATRYVRDMLRNKDAMDRKLNAFKTIPYAWYLSANLRLAVTQMFQNAVTAYPILARLQQENGVKGSAALRLEKSMQDITKHSTGMKGAVSEIELKMLQDAYEQGETLANYINEMKGKVEGNWAKTYFMKLLDVVSIPFAGMERFNRRTSLLAAFRMYTEAGKPYGEAFELSKEFVRHAHYAYGLSNFPQLMRDGTPFSKVAGMAYVFKSFPHNYVLSMLHFAKDKDGKLALGVMMRSIAMLAILGGLTAVPFLDDILEEYEQLSGDPVRSKMRIAMKKYGGDMLGQVGMEGLPALAGVDMSGTVKMQIPIPGIGEFDPGTFTMGVWGGLIDKGKRAIEFASDSQWARAIEAGTPVGVEMMLKARRMAKEGLKTAGEREILDVSGKPIMPTMYETGAQVAGFRPERIAEIQKERRVAQNIKEKFSRQRDDIRKRLRRASTQKDFEGIRKDVEKYNLHVMKYRGVIPRISSQSLKAALKPETGYMKYGRVEEEF